MHSCPYVCGQLDLFYEALWQVLSNFPSSTMSVKLFVAPKLTFRSPDQEPSNLSSPHLHVKAHPEGERMRAFVSSA